jgi:hypothetical protein
MSTDPQGNVLLTGYFEESVALNPHPARKFILSEGSFDMFILGLKPDGQSLWATGQGGHGPDGASSIATDNVGGIYTTGYFFGVMDADPGIGSDILQSNGLEDIFIGKWQGMTVSVKEALSSDMTLYPNPGTGPYIIELSEAVNGTLTIYDAFGKSVQQLSVNGNEILLKVELAPGTYWIMIESERRQTYTQLVIP